MKLMGILAALLGWMIAVAGMAWSSSLTIRLSLCLGGIAVSATGIMGLLNPAHLKEAIWKK